MMEHRIYIHATKTSDGDIEFTPVSFLWRKTQEHPQGCLVFSKDENMMHRSDHHVVQFVIDDDTGYGLKFPADPNDAFWICEGTACPQSKSASSYPSVTPQSIVDRRNGGPRQMLIVRNDNMEKATCSFAINFERDKPGPNGEKTAQWDPIWQNQNGGLN